MDFDWLIGLKRQKYWVFLVRFQNLDLIHRRKQSHFGKHTVRLFVEDLVYD